MKNFLPFMFFLLSIAAIDVVKAQTVSITANGSTTQLNGLGYLNYHVSEYIYTDTELGASNFITSGTAISKINLNASVVGSPNFFNNVKIYLKNVSSATTSLASGTYTTAGYTEVFSGTFTASSTGWVGVNLTTPFVRTAGSNLQMMIERTDNVDHSTTAALFTWVSANGNNLSSTATTSRRYNGTSALSAATSLSASAFRVATQFIHINPLDASVIDISTPTSSCFSSNQSISVTIGNVGLNSLASSTVPVTLQISGANTYTSTVSNTSTINSGSNTTIVFTGINLNNVGNNNITAYCSLSGDGSFANDTLRTTIVTTDVRTTFPVSTSAEVSPLIFQYTKVLSNSNDWYLNTAFTASTTGACINSSLNDSIYPKTGTKFYVFDSYNGLSGNRSVLHAGCFSFPITNGTNVYDMSFWMTQDTSFTYSGYRDSIYAVVSTDKGVTWTRLLPGFARINSSYSTPGWIQRNVNLSSYAGQTIQLGLEGVSQYGNLIGIDDIVVRANNPLPITLSNFSGKKEGIQNLLAWTTANETNNFGFELQRSINGTDFSTITTIASKADNGNSATSLNYSYSDKTPLKGTNYYRLYQLDKDGKGTYSKVVVIKSLTKGVEISNVYPNPAKDNISLTINSATKSQYTISIYDLIGKEIARKSVDVSGSMNVQFSTVEFTKGTYIIKVTSSENTVLDTQRFIKQ